MYRKLVNAVAVVCLIGGPLSDLVWGLIWPGAEGAPAALNVTSIERARGLADVGVWLDLGVLLLVPAALFAGRALGAATRPLAGVATGLLFAGSLAFTYMLPADAVLIAAAGTGGSATAQAFLDSGAVTVATVTGVTATFVGSVLLGVAALRSRRIPAWAGLFLLASNPLEVAGTVIGSTAVAAAGLALLLAAYAACALRFVRPVPQVVPAVVVAESAL